VRRRRARQLDGGERAGTDGGREGARKQRAQRPARRAAHRATATGRSLIAVAAEGDGGDDGIAEP
jgi:hypothetical protein